MKVLIKEVEDFIKTTEVLYYLGKKKKFYIKLHAAPMVERYIVVIDGNRHGFIKRNEAVKFFNEAM